MNTDFHQSSYRAQVLRLRRLAEIAVQRFAIRPWAIDFINHGENTSRLQMSLRRQTSCLVVLALLTI